VSPLWRRDRCALERGDTGPAAVLAMPLFVAANLIILLLTLGTLRLLLQGKLVPKPVSAA
jgi:tellurite resistance protein